jgi:LysM repeat protein
VLCGLVWGGCAPSGPGVTDEEKEPQFLIGRSRVSMSDFGGAIEAFQLALETNPQSAAAHFQLGWLYAEKNSDPAAAIYHYEQFLRRRPTAPNAEMIRQQILGLKQKLAEAAFPMPPTAGAQKQIEDLMKENRQLRAERAELERLLHDTAARPGPTNPPPGRVASGRISSVSGGRLAKANLPLPNSGPSGSPSPGVRTHKVISGDTPISIARRYSIKVEALLAANPGLNPRRMRIDQSLTIPGR